MFGFIVAFVFRPSFLTDSTLHYRRSGRIGMVPEVSRRARRMRTAALDSVQLDWSRAVGPRRVDRVWQDINTSRRTDLSAMGERPPVVTVLSYNVLAQAYVSKRIFPDSSHSVLRAKQRAIAVIEELRAYAEEYDVDVLCLQELEQNMCTAITRELVEFGSFAYKLRTSAGTRHKRDGCGIFWRKSRFECLHDRNLWHVELNDIADDAELSPLFESRAEAIRDCVSAMVCLREVKTGNRFVVTSSHLFWDPTFPLVKLAQAFRVREAAFELANASATNFIVLAGDWNSLPNSSVFALLADGRISGSYPDCLSIEELQARAVNRGTEEILQSVHRFGRNISDVTLSEDTVDGMLTTYTGKFKGALDHVFVTAECGDENIVLGILSLPTKTDFVRQNITALPCEGHPSDHIPIVARLLLARGALGSKCSAELEADRSASVAEDQGATMSWLDKRLRSLCNVA